MRRFLLTLIPLAALTLSGCTSSQGFERGGGTNADVRMEKKNYKVIKAAATGKSSGFYLLGFIPFWSPTYNEAKQNLYASVGVPLEGKATALANQSEDNTFGY
jgi:hypothetical protein